MGDNWVGFQKSPKLPTGTSIEFKSEWICSLPDVEVVSRYTTANGFEKWFATVKEFDSRRGGKLSFQIGKTFFAGTYTNFELPKLVELVTDHYGLLSFSFDPDSKLIQFRQVILSEISISELESVFAKLSEQLKAVTQ